MTTPLPPIYRDCRRLLVLTEDLVRCFSRYHKYTVGTDLRQAAMGIMRTVNQAVHDKPRQAQHVQALVWRVDDFKLTLQLSMDVGVFAQGQRGRRVTACTRCAGPPRFTEWARLLWAFGVRGQTMTKLRYRRDAWPRCKRVPWRCRPMWATPTTPGTSISTMATSTTTTATTTTRCAWCVPVSGASDAACSRI